MRKAVQIRGLRHSQTLLGEFKDREHLLPLHARKPPQEIVHTGSVFKILEKSLYWHARAFEQPHTADFPRNALNSRTLIPIEHCWSIAVLVWRNKDQNHRCAIGPCDTRLQRTLTPRNKERGREKTHRLADEYKQTLGQSGAQISRTWRDLRYRTDMNRRA